MSETSPNNLDALHRLWQERDGNWQASEDLFLDYGRRALEFGHPSLAVNILSEAAASFPDNHEVIFRLSLALARGGSTRAAEKVLSPLLGSLAAADPLYTEVLSLAGRLCKDRYQKLEDSPEKLSAAQESADYYSQAFTATGLYFPGINAATMSFVAGEGDAALEIAEKVLANCLKEHGECQQSDYWLLATLAEASLLLGKMDDAVHWYRQATAAAGQRFGDIASMRRQVKMLGQYIDLAPELLQVLDIPAIVAFSGHMLDAPGRSSARFPPAIEKQVAAEIRDALERLGAEFGYCSAACGSDMLFIEAMLDRKAEVHVVLPFKREDFIHTSLAFAGDSWVRRFEELMHRVTSVSYATEEGHLGDDILFEYTGDLINGKALLRGAQLDTDPMLLAVMEPSPADRVGGTVGAVSRWHSSGNKVEVIDIAAIRELAGVVSSPTVEEHIACTKEEALPEAERTSPRVIRTMLFADMVGFSKLGEESAPTFFLEFLGHISEVIRNSVNKPRFSNTWGDGLYIVFDTVADAADFAVRLRDAIVNKDWVAVGLPKETNIRIALHAGPVYRGRDPIIGRDNFFGSHVTRAARIEPVTTPGSVFVSEQSACLLALDDQNDFSCDYLGMIKFAKNYGSGALYRLRRANSAD